MTTPVQHAVLRQLAERGKADASTTKALVPGTDERDLQVALENLLDEGSIVGETGRAVSLVALAADGHLTLTAVGQRRLDEESR